MNDKKKILLMASLIIIFIIFLIEFTYLVSKINGTKNNPTIQSYQESILNGADPILEKGMIPVKISETGEVTTADISSEWYKYQNKEWANAILVDRDSRRKYIRLNGTIKANKKVEQSDILAYYVWIPRYKYTFPDANGSPEEISIVFSSAYETKSLGTGKGTSYYTHPAFTFGDEELNGIWVGKFETTGTGKEPTILPNKTSLRGYDKSNEELSSETTDTSLTNISDYFKVSLKFAGGKQIGSTITFSGNKTYGLTNSTDSHMIKNSEWGAVAYLSHSQYGINEEIRLNNNNTYITGCGASEWMIEETSSCQIAYGIPSNEKNTYPQSTTGNITGIFDMSGGAEENVMGNYKGIVGKSGFDLMPDEKYYDKYTSISLSVCSLEECEGHALNETFKWYTDYTSFVNENSPWFDRGGGYGSGLFAGAFYSHLYNGKVNSYYSFRSVIVKGT